jgi:hypothetical protein
MGFALGAVPGPVDLRLGLCPTNPAKIGVAVIGTNLSIRVRVNLPCMRAIHDNCPIPESSDKYREAHYFLDVMLAHYHDPQVFRWNLNGFLQALRNVTFVMQKELRHHPGFEEWWAIQSKIMERDGILRRFKNGRNIIVKERSLRLKSKASVGVFRWRRLKLAFDTDVDVNANSVDLLEKAKGTVNELWIPEKYPEPGEEVGLQRMWIAPELGRIEVVRLCEKAWLRLGRIMENAHTFCGIGYPKPPSHIHDVESMSIIVESDLDPTVPERWKWFNYWTLQGGQDSLDNFF